MLIETPAGILNTAQIASVRVERSAAWEERCAVTYIDGRTETLDCGVAHFEKACGTVVPAPPGFALIRAVVPADDEVGGGLGFVEEAVIAFRVVGRGEPIPVTVSGEPDPTDPAPWCVRQPGGACVSPVGGHETAEAFRERCRREHDPAAPDPAADAPDEVPR